MNIDVDDVDKAAGFYTNALGLRIGRRFGDTAIELLGAGVNIYLLSNAPGTAPFKGAIERRSYDRHWTPVHLDFVVNGLETWVERVQAGGGRTEGAIQEHAWGRMALMADPFGNGFCLLELTEAGYDAVNTL